MTSSTASSTASAYALLKINISRVVPSTTSRQRSGSVRLPLFDEKRSGPPSRAESPDHEYHPVPHGQPYVHRPPWWPHWALKYATWSNFFTLAKYLIPSLILWLVYLWWTYEFYFEMYVYKREWAYREVVQVEPLAGCFNPGRISPAYNISEAVYGPKRHNIQGGVPLRIDMDCYNLAGTIRNSALNPKPPVSSTKGRQLFHTYWRTDLVPFGERQEWMLKSFFATQDLQSSTLILWSNGDLSQSPYLVKWLKRYPHAFKTRLVDIQAWSKGTALEGSPLLGIEDEKAWVDGDLVRLLVAWAFGGVWIDMDSLFTRDLSPLLDHEFFTAWDCYERRYQALNGALMHFFKHSPYLCEAFHIMARSAPPRAGSTDWGSDLYFKLWRRLIAAGVPPFQVLPFCFSDGGLCRADNRIPDPFDPDPASWGMGRSLKEGGELDQVLNKVFVLHLHNRWEKKFPRSGWVERLLLTKFERRLAEMEMELDLDRKPTVISPPPPPAVAAADENQAPMAHKPPPPRVILKRDVPPTDATEEDEEDDTPVVPEAEVVLIENDHNATN